MAVVTMQGDVTTATQCVGRYWQKTILNDLGAWWTVYTYSYQVMVHGPGGGTPPPGLVINFDNINGKTIASAHVHPMFPKSDPRYTVTKQALNACRVQ